MKSQVMFQIKDPQIKDYQIKDYQIKDYQVKDYQVKSKVQDLNLLFQIKDYQVQSKVQDLNLMFEVLNKSLFTPQLIECEEKQLLCVHARGGKTIKMCPLDRKSLIY